MFKVVEYHDKKYKLSYSKYLHFIAYSKAVMSTSWNDDDKRAAVERYLNTLIN